MLSRTPSHVMVFRLAQPQNFYCHNASESLPGKFNYFCHIYNPRNSAKFNLSFRVARKSVFFAVSSVVLNISPIVRSFRP